MRHISWIAVSISLSLLPILSFAQNASQSGSSASASASPSVVDDDPAFAGFQRLGPGMKPPKAISAPDPNFPDLPADAEPRGTVVLLIGVNTKGRVEVVRVLRSDEAAFEKSAVATVRKWKFKPAMEDGHPVPVQISVEIKFQR